MTREADRLTQALWLVSALFIVYGTTLPFSFDGTSHEVSTRLGRFWFSTPWSLQSRDQLSVADVVQNVLLFVPFGMLGFLASRPGPMATRVFLITGAGALLSGSVEIVQLFTADRISSLTDLATNTTGAALGALAAAIGRGVALRTLARLIRAGLLDDTTCYPLLVFLGVVALAAWQPFDVTLDVGTVGHKVRLLLRDPWQFDGIKDEIIGFVQAALFAGAVCHWLRGIGVKTPVLTGALAAIAVTTGLEASQVLIAGRQPALASAVFRAAGCLTGVALWAAFARTASHRLFVAAVALGSLAGGAVQMLSPFQLAARYQPVQWIPFLSYYAYTSFETVSHTFELLLLYLPLGFVVGAASQGRVGRALGRGAGLAIGMAVPLEYAQGWMIGRYPDVTDVALSAAGACIGAWLATEGARRFSRLTMDMGRR